ncbi:MAG TPA: ABC transporter ATP-binding protein [Mycobacterium sp.]|uniref:ABC transporter ATP-binding protein n=1 Tax=Mycobacterium sp. TaxID=1785 RepID=UPI002D6DCDAD|nr:ABC transporter ATP-binding protein [Mycobacterium sp.]HZU48399.1 ABC transporter ATP-binding protein [Mycobacterium sp.]
MTRLILELIRPYRWVIGIILAAMLVQTAMNLAGPWPLKIILDNVVVTKHPLPQWMTGLLPVFGGSSRAHIAELAAIFFVIIAVLNAISSYIGNYYTEVVGQWVAYDLRTRTYHHLQRLSLSYYDSHQVGAIVSTINDDVDTIQDFASGSVTDMIIDILQIVGILAVMFAIRWDFALIAVAVTPFLLFFVSRVRKAVKKATHEVRLRQADIVSTVQQGLESVRVVQAFEREDLQEEELRRVGIQTVQAGLQARKIKALLSPVVNIVVAACTGLVLWRGTSLVMAGAMEVGTLTVFLSYLAMFFKPVQDLATMTNTIAQTSVGVERVRAILDADAIIPERPDAIEPQILRGQVEFEHVSFGYDAAQPVLRDVSFTIEPGQLVGVVGPTGSGKSTVVSLIPRFYDPNAGSIKIDGVDIRDYKLHELRQHIGFVLQDTVLFRGSVRDNIAYGHPRATDDEIVHAAKLANAHEFISRMPHGYDSPVGERGLTLSGGQRQRIGIARAIIRDNPILILDEPTAALDTESEELVIEALERLMKGRTVITIAHRLSTIRDAHNIIVLKDGVVAETGTHEQLLALGGVYAGLHRIQYQETSA